MTRAVDAERRSVIDATANVVSAETGVFCDSDSAKRILTGIIGALGLRGYTVVMVNPMEIALDDAVKYVSEYERRVERGEAPQTSRYRIAYLHMLNNPKNSFIWRYFTPLRSVPIGAGDDSDEGGDGKTRVVTVTDIRGAIERAAEDVKDILTERGADHSFDHGVAEKTAAMWSAYCGASFSAADVYVMLALMKTARFVNGVNVNDSSLDAAGYWVLARQYIQSGRGNGEG